MDMMNVVENDRLRQFNSQVFCLAVTISPLNYLLGVCAEPEAGVALAPTSGEDTEEGAELPMAGALKVTEDSVAEAAGALVTGALGTEGASIGAGAGGGGAVGADSGFLPQAARTTSNGANRSKDFIAFLRELKNRGI